jgi:hypothetical protein
MVERPMAADRRPPLGGHGGRRSRDAGKGDNAGGWECFANSKLKSGRKKTITVILFWLPGIL